MKCPRKAHARSQRKPGELRSEYHKQRDLQSRPQYQKKNSQDFPGGPEVKNLPVSAWSGKIPLALRQLSPCTATTDSAL